MPTVSAEPDPFVLATVGMEEQAQEDEAKSRVRMMDRAPKATRKRRSTSTFNPARTTPSRYPHLFSLATPNPATPRPRGMISATG